MSDCRVDCPIKDGGYCERHKVRKTADWAELCATRGNYWLAWEEGRGPGQNISATQHPSSTDGGGMPSIATQAWSVSKAIASFVCDGCKTVDANEYARRLSICETCNHRIRNRCRKCGCFLSIKAKGRAFKCPIGKWEENSRRWRAPISSDLERKWADAYMAGDDNPEYTNTSQWRYVRTSELASATVKLTAQIPREVAGVAGISRSGILPASIIATHLHIPLLEYSLGSGLRKLSNGIRGHNFAKLDISNKPILVVDDTIYSGYAMKCAREMLSGRKAYYACVYTRPSKAGLVDFFSEILPSPHLLEWNLWSSGMTRGLISNPHFQGGLATDLDGVLCEDFVIDGDDTTEGDEKYRQAMLVARPLATAGLYPIPLIVTYRLERFRSETEDWLRRNRIMYDKLVMHQAEKFGDRDFSTPQLKIDAYSESKCSLFVESCPIQADFIHARTGRPVLCVADGRIRQ